VRQQVVQYISRANKVPVIQVPLRPTPWDLRQVLGQRQDAHGEEKRTTGVTLMHTFRARDGETAIREQGTLPCVASQRVGEEPRAVFGHCVEEDLAFDRVERIPKVQLEEDVVRGRLLEPHAYFVYQALGPSEYTNSHLLWLQAAGSFGLVPAD
jgi:hypothetical protein